MHSPQNDITQIDNAVATNSLGFTMHSPRNSIGVTMHSPQNIYRIDNSFTARQHQIDHAFPTKQHRMYKAFKEKQHQADGPCIHHTAASDSKCNHRKTTTAPTLPAGRRFHAWKEIRGDFLEKCALSKNVRNETESCSIRHLPVTDHPHAKRRTGGGDLGKSTPWLEFRPGG